jgi:hypothetical protein
MTFRTTQSALLLKLDTVILFTSATTNTLTTRFLFKVDVDPPLSGSST